MLPAILPEKNFYTFSIDDHLNLTHQPATAAESECLFEGWRSMFSHFSVNSFALRLKAVDEIHLPAYQGATLRGGFGHALKQVCCALRRQECAACMLRERCVYLYLFETPPPTDAEMMRLYPSAPHPFIIEPPDSGVRVVEPGEPLEFGLTLIGRALEYIPYFIYAFMVLGEKGLGRGKAKFSLEDVRTQTSDGLLSIYQSENQSLKKPVPYPSPSVVNARSEALGAVERLEIHFTTPARIKSDGHLNDEPEFHHLVRSLLRRLSSLSYFHCGRKLEADFKGLIERARKVERTSSDLRWHDWERYSSRQKQKMTLGGFVGKAEFRGDLKESPPMPAWGEILHIGKAASFGLGKYSVMSN